MSIFHDHNELSLYQSDYEYNTRIRFLSQIRGCVFHRQGETVKQSERLKHVNSSEPFLGTLTPHLINMEHPNSRTMGFGVFFQLPCDI
jgi:hypothetical protein